MAIDAQVDVLKEGAQIWNAWRAERPESVPDLSGGHLRGFDLRNTDLSGADLTRAGLRGVQFLNCPQLETALNWQSTYRDEDLACGAVIPNH